MKTLVVCRHAKSSWKYPVQDIYRPLNGRGLVQAPEMAENCQFVPDKVLCSPAVRAWSTALAYFTELNWDYDILRMSPELIEASENTIMTLLKCQSPSDNVLFIFGHNPGFNSLVDTLCSSEQHIPNIVTSARVTLQLSIENWSDLKPGCADLIAWQIPDKPSN